VDWDVAIARGLLRLDCIAFEDEAATPVRAFEAAARLLGEAHGVNAPALVQRLVAREARGSSVVACGIAIPHADSWGITRPQAAYLRSKRPLEFLQTAGREPVHDMLVLVAPRPATAIYTHMLKHYHTLAASARFRAALHACASAEELWKLMRENEWNRERDAARTLLTARLRDKVPTAGNS
jgi:PTS system nitrogen regulatory IIA component